MLVHHALSALITRAAEAADLDPDRVSFTRVLRIARRTATGTEGFPPEGWHDVLPHVLADITRKINPPRRHRSCPRAVKRGRHNSYRIKKPGQTGTHHSGPARRSPRAARPAWGTRQPGPWLLWRPRRQGAQAGSGEPVQARPCLTMRSTTMSACIRLIDRRQTLVGCSTRHWRSACPRERPGSRQISS